MPVAPRARPKHICLPACRRSAPRRQDPGDGDRRGALEVVGQVGSFAVFLQRRNALCWRSPRMITTPGTARAAVTNSSTSASYRATRRLGQADVEGVGEEAGLLGRSSRTGSVDSRRRPPTRCKRELPRGSSRLAPGRRPSSFPWRPRYLHVLARHSRAPRPPPRVLRAHERGNRAREHVADCCSEPHRRLYTIGVISSGYPPARGKNRVQLPFVQSGDRCTSRAARTCAKVLETRRLRREGRHFGGSRPCSPSASRSASVKSCPFCIAGSAARHRPGWRGATVSCVLVQQLRSWFRAALDLSSCPSAPLDGSARASVSRTPSPFSAVEV